MALELLAGPFPVIDRATGLALGSTLSGTPIWQDDAGLLLPVSTSGVYLMQMDGAAHRIADDSSLVFGLALLGPAADPRDARRWYALTKTHVFEPAEWNLHEVTRHRGALIQNQTVVLGANFARMLDRYLRPLGAGIYTAVVGYYLADWTAESTKTGLSNAKNLSWGDETRHIVVGSTDGLVATYDWFDKTFVGDVRTIGMSCLGLWYSAKHRVFVSLHNASGTLEVRVWAATIRPTSISAPAADPALKVGLRSTITVRVLGSNADPCEGEVVAWSLLGPGALGASATATDADGYARNTYDAPFDSGGASAQITAEVAI